MHDLTLEGLKEQRDELLNQLALMDPNRTESGALKTVEGGMDTTADSIKQTQAQLADVERQIAERERQSHA